MDEDQRFAELLGRSSLGSRAARELRERTPASRAHAVRIIAELQSEIATADPETAKRAADELARLLTSLGFSDRERLRSGADHLSDPAFAALLEENGGITIPAERKAADLSRDDQNADRPEPAREIEALAPRRRLALRAHPAVIASIRGSLLLRLVRFASEPHRDFGLDRDLAQALALARARDLDPTARAHARVLALALARDLDPTARGLARDLAFARDLALDRARDLDRARYLALLLDEPASRALGIQHMDGLGTALLDGALDDFTRADLSAADLVGVDLDGVRWSLWGTRWPPATDVERLKNQSRETRPGSGVFVVSGGTSTADLTRV